MQSRRRSQWIELSALALHMQGSLLLLSLFGNCVRTKCLWTNVICVDLSVTWRQRYPQFVLTQVVSIILRTTKHATFLHRLRPRKASGGLRPSLSQTKFNRDARNEDRKFFEIIDANISLDEKEAASGIIKKYFAGSISMQLIADNIAAIDVGLRVKVPASDLVARNTATDPTSEKQPLKGSAR